MEKYNYKYYLFILLIISAGCETDVENVDLPVFKQKLVITSFISPSDTISYINVRSNMKLFGELNTEKPLGNLAGFISDGTNEVALDTALKGLKINSRNMQIKYGTSYNIRVESESGLNAEGSCTVPVKSNFAIDIDTFSIERQLPAGGPYPYGSQYRSINFSVSIQDTQGEENFYRIAGESMGYYRNPQTQNPYTTESSLTFEKEYISDNGMDGKRIVFTTIGNYSYYFSSSRDSTFLKIYLFNTEKSYYQYHKSLNDYNDGENPFSEATPVYSNIIGGLGIFTSYTVDSLVIRLK